MATTFDVVWHGMPTFCIGGFMFPLIADKTYNQGQLTMTESETLFVRTLGWPFFFTLNGEVSLLDEWTHHGSMSISLQVIS